MKASFDATGGLVVTGGTNGIGGPATVPTPRSERMPNDGMRRPGRPDHGAGVEHWGVAVTRSFWRAVGR